MKQIDNQVLHNAYDEELLLTHVVQQDAELLYLDSFLSAVFRSEA